MRYKTLIIFLIIVFVQIFFFQIALAQDIYGGCTPDDPNSFPNPLSACSFQELITRIARFLLRLALAFAFFMMIWAGFKFITAGGNEEKITSAKKNLTWTVIGIAVILASEQLVIYIEEILGVREVRTRTFEAFIERISGTLDLIVILLFSLATVYFLWGVIQYVMGARGDDEKLEQGKRHMVWGIIGMAIMASAWGIVELIRAYILQ